MNIVMWVTLATATLIVAMLNPNNNGVIVMLGIICYLLYEIKEAKDD